MFVRLFTSSQKFEKQQKQHVAFTKAMYCTSISFAFFSCPESALYALAASQMKMLFLADLHCSTDTENFPVFRVEQQRQLWCKAQET
jgi:hypothetical protein